MSEESPRDERMSSDPETIRKWAVDRDIVPVETSETERAPGVDLVPASEGEAYEILEWEEFADRLAEFELVVQQEDDDLELVHGEQIEQDTFKEPAEPESTDYETHPEMDEPVEPGMDEPVERERREHGPSSGGSVERGGTSLDEGDKGKTVVVDAGQEVGIVVEVDETERIIHVDTDPSFTQKIMAKIGWSDAGGGDYPVEAERIQEITDDKVVLRGGSMAGEADRE